jgi:hypothetical protein
MEDAMAEITIDDIERSNRVRAVTDNFFFWQGRRFVALGLAMIVAGLATMPAIHEAVGNSVMIASLIAAMLASTWLGRRYRVEFGDVRPIPGAHSARARLKWLVVYPAMIGAIMLDLLYPLPILLSGPVWAGGLYLYRRSTGGGRDHYLVLIAMLAALALVPMLSGATGKQAISLMFLLLGAGYAVCAWLDDREMRSILRGG